MIFSISQSAASAIAWSFIPLSKEGLTDRLQQLAAAYEIPVAQLAEDFDAEAGKSSLIYTATQRLLLLGLGEKPTFGKTLDAFRAAVHTWRKQFTSEVQVDWQYIDASATDFEAAANGLCLGTYTIGRYKEEPEAPHPLAATVATATFVVAARQTEEARAAAHRGSIMADSQLAMMDLVNAPSNHKTPAHLVKFVRESAAAYGYEVQIWQGEECAKAGLHALMAVNRGSEHPPAFIVAHYKGPGAKRQVALVGKGVTFDTGGLSLKPSTNMHFMKSDMGGAAAVLGTMEVAARLQLPIELIGIVPSTDNSIDSLSTKPSEVFHSYSGKTIEMIDTDAEGRLVLADGLAYAVKNYQPEVLIDLATLTGSAVRTFGYSAGALFSNDDALADALYTAGIETGEKVWRLPIWEEYSDMVSSDVADVRNFSGKPLAGAIAAAKFLEVFTNEHPRWAHLDIAGVAFGDSRYAKSKSATAFGIRLLVTYLMRGED